MSLRVLLPPKALDDVSHGGMPEEVVLFDQGLVLLDCVVFEAIDQLLVVGRVHYTLQLQDIVVLRQG